MHDGGNQIIRFKAALLLLWIGAFEAVSGALSVVHCSPVCYAERPLLLLYIHDMDYCSPPIIHGSGVMVERPNPQHTTPQCALSVAFGPLLANQQRRW